MNDRFGNIRRGSIEFEFVSITRRDVYGSNVRSRCYFNMKSILLKMKQQTDTSTLTIIGYSLQSIRKTVDVAFIFIVIIFVDLIKENDEIRWYLPPIFSGVFPIGFCLFDQPMENVNVIC